MSTDSPNSQPKPEDAVETPDVVETPEAVETPAVPETEVPETDMPSGELPDLEIGSGAAEVTIDPNYVPVVRGKIDRFGVAMGTGRRKSSVARVRIKDGSGKFIVNGKELTEYLRVERDQQMVLAPLKMVGKDASHDVSVRVNGGGTTGQTGAIILGIARALQGLFPECHHDLAHAGYLTRDDRMVERKKYGLKKARKSFQFSKR